MRGTTNPDLLSKNKIRNEDTARVSWRRKQIQPERELVFDCVMIKAGRNTSLSFTCVSTANR